MSYEITVEELLDRYAAGERNFPGVTLIQPLRVGMIEIQGVDLRGINLRGAFLEEVDLTGANLSGADLSGAYLSWAWLKDAIVKDASLHSANLTWCSLMNADFRGSNLEHMNACSALFDDAWLSGFSNTILIGTSFRNARVASNIILSYGNFVYKTIMPDGSVIETPSFGEW
jgi:uncharacterized protein YjbI with pentapeptide repeats